MDSSSPFSYSERFAIGVAPEILTYNEMVARRGSILDFNNECGDLPSHSDSTHLFKYDEVQSSFTLGSPIKDENLHDDNYGGCAYLDSIPPLPQNDYSPSFNAANTTFEPNLYMSRTSTLGEMYRHAPTTHHSGPDELDPSLGRWGMEQQHGPSLAASNLAHYTYLGAAIAPVDVATSSTGVASAPDVFNGISCTAYQPTTTNGKPQAFEAKERRKRSGSFPANSLIAHKTSPHCTIPSWVNAKQRNTTHKMPQTYPSSNDRWYSQQQQNDLNRELRIRPRLPYGDTGLPQDADAQETMVKQLFDAIIDNRYFFGSASGQVAPLVKGKLKVLYIISRARDIVSKTVEYHQHGLMVPKYTKNELTGYDIAGAHKFNDEFNDTFRDRFSNILDATRLSKLVCTDFLLGRIDITTFVLAPKKALKDKLKFEDSNAIRAERAKKRRTSVRGTAIVQRDDGQDEEEEERAGLDQRQYIQQKRRKFTSISP